MSDVALKLVEEPDVDGPENDPKVFARSISAPPGAPWDQLRAARLEARAGAPLPIGEIVHQLRRLEPWRPGHGAKFVAFYARASDVGARLQTQALVDGRWMEVVFVSRAEQERKAKLALAAVGAGAFGALLVLASVAVAISARNSTERQLAALEQVAGAKARLAKGADVHRRQSVALEAAGMRGRALADYLGDLDWAASAKAPGARLQAVHWDRGTMAVEVRGETAPFVAAGREVTKMDKPLRPGLWLWGVSTAPAAETHEESSLSEDPGDPPSSAP